jgi:hypothetical protein
VHDRHSHAADAFRGPAVRHRTPEEPRPVVDEYSYQFPSPLSWYEVALLEAYIGRRTNYAKWSLADLQSCFTIADRGRLRDAGDPLPGSGPFTLYRGVAGHGRMRRLRGLSWTSSLERAAWFATRFPHLPDPAVVTVTVNAVKVAAYLDKPVGRGEQEFLVLLSSDDRLHRVACNLRELAGAVRRATEHSDTHIEGGA